MELGGPGDDQTAAPLHSEEPPLFQRFLLHCWFAGLYLELHAIGQLDTSVPQASGCPGSIGWQEPLAYSIRLFLILSS